MIAFLQSHWPTIAATCATIALWCLSVYVSRRPDIRAGGLVELGANALLMVLPRLGWPGRLLAFAIRPLATPDGYQVQLVRSMPRLRLATKEREPIPLGRFVPLLALLLPGLAWAQDAAEPAPPPTPGVHPLLPLAIAIGIALLVLIGLLCARAIERRSDKLLVLLACLVANQAACGPGWRNDAGGMDLISQATRDRMAAVVDCLGIAVSSESGPLLSGALAIVLDGEQRSIARWKDLLVPFVRAVDARVGACLRPAARLTATEATTPARVLGPPPVEVRLATEPPSITVEPPAPAGAAP